MGVDVTDTSPAAVHSKLTRLFVMPRDIELHVDVQDICNALMAERGALSAQLAAANALADEARDKALLEAAKWHVRQAEAAMGALHCGSENSDIRAAGRVNDMYREAAHAILALRDKPAPAVTVRAYLLRHRDTGKEDIIDAKKYNPTKLDFWISPSAMASVEIVPLGAIAGGGDE